MTIRILFFNPEQYVPFEHEPSNIQCRLPILHCGLDLEPHDHIYQRTLRAGGPAAMEREALAAVDEVKPDLVVYSATWEHENLPPWTLAAIRRRGIPVVSVLWDSWIEPTTSEVELLANSDVLVVCDSLQTYLRCSLLAASTPGSRQVAFQGGHVFTDLIRRDPSVTKDIDVLVLGSNEGVRAGLVAQLAERLPQLGIGFAKLGGLVDSTRSGQFALSDDWIDWPSYVKAINRAHICINGTTDPGRVQIKGKIFDYMACGSLCLTQTNPEIERFIPGKALVTFEDAESCLDRIQSLMADSGRREAISAEGHRWLTETFDYRRFWRSVLLAALGRGRVEEPRLADRTTLSAMLETGSSLLRRQASLASDAAKMGFALGRTTREPLAWSGRHRGWYLLRTEGWGCFAVAKMPVDLLATENGPMMVGPHDRPRSLLDAAGTADDVRHAESIEALKALLDLHA